MNTYKRLRADYEYLESVSDTADLVEVSAEVFALMREPTRKKAAEMYYSSILAWFCGVGKRSIHTSSIDQTPAEVLDDPKVQEIKERYGL